MPLIKKKVYCCFLLKVLTVILLFYFSIFSYPSICSADVLEDELEEIIQDFQRHINVINKKKKYYIVVRSFVDKKTKKPNTLTEEVESILIDIMIDRFSEKKNIVILERERIEAIEKEIAFETNATHFQHNAWEQKLGKKIGAGFLITGKISKRSKTLKIRAKMIDLITGEILSSSSGKVRIDELDKDLIIDYIVLKKKIHKQQIKVLKESNNRIVLLVSGDPPPASMTILAKKSSAIKNTETKASAFIKKQIGDFVFNSEKLILDDITYDNNFAATITYSYYY